MRLGSEKVSDFVLSTRVSDPLSVRSVAFCLPLAAALKTTLLRHGFHFRATVVFRSVATHFTEVVQEISLERKVRGENG